LGTCGFGGRGDCRGAPGGRAGCFAARVSGGDFDYDADGTRAGAEEVWEWAGLLLSVGSAVGCGGAASVAEAADAGAGGDGVLAESAGGLPWGWNSSGGGKCADFGSQLAA